MTQTYHSPYSTDDFSRNLSAERSLTPVEASSFLIGLGFETDDFAKLASGEHTAASHSLRLLSEIATGSAVTISEAATKNLGPTEKARHTEADKTADLAADNAAANGAWERFMAQSH